MALPSVAVDPVRDNSSGGGKLLAVIQAADELDKSQDRRPLKK
jgi:hypothetical protein